jgi:hypothetical protein
MDKKYNLATNLIKNILSIPFVMKFYISVDILLPNTLRSWHSTKYYTKNVNDAIQAYQ